ncbi:MAG TPA: 4Fe-4S binding protein, partial [Lachnospiraceae bacterium]|nr:4Fe-4S binding protein [Lachnospiraceae bacterium]
GKTMMGEVSAAVSLEKVLVAIGVDVKIVNPLDFEDAIAAVKEMDEKSGVRAIIFRSPCVAIVKPDQARHIDTNTCIGCMKCIRELGCPALSKKDGKAVIDPALCTGCGLCSKVCPTGCIVKD